MADVEVSTVFKLVDAATKPLRAIGAAARGVSGVLDRATSGMARMAGIAGGISVGLAFKKSISEVVELTDQTRRLMAITKKGPEETSAWLKTMTLLGLPAHDLERTMGLLARKQAQLGMGGKTVAKQFSALGVDLKKGPVEAFTGMAEKAKAGQLNAGMLGLALRMMPGEAAKMINVLKQGPDAIRDGVTEALKMGAVIDTTTLQNVSSYKRAKRGLSEIWSSAKVIIGKELIPVVSQLASGMVLKFKEIIPVVQDIGRFLREHMTQAITLAQTFGKIMLTNLAVMKTTSLLGIGGPAGMGIGGVIGRGAGFVAGKGAGMIGAGVRGIGGGVAQAVGGRGFFGMIQGLVGGFGRIGASIWGIGKGFLSIAGRLGVVGLIITVIVAAVRMIASNWGRIVTWAGELWDRLSAHFTVIGQVFSPVVDFFSASGPIGRFFGWLLPAAIDGLATVVEKILQAVAAIGIYIGRVMESPRAVWRKGIGASIAEAWSEAGAMQRRELIATKQAQFTEQAMAANERMRAALAGGIPDKRPSQPHYDFRGSHFSIKQDFAEGFDPDRIAAAFASDLSKLGERRLSSGFSPLFAVR